MQNIDPEQIFDYMNNIVNYEKAKKLTSITIARCIYHITLEIKEHSLNFNCHCFKCRVCRILLAILVERKQGKLLLLINTSNYNVISEETLYDNVIICQ